MHQMSFNATLCLDPLWELRHPRPSSHDRERVREERKRGKGREGKAKGKERRKMERKGRKEGRGGEGCAWRTPGI